MNPPLDDVGVRARGLATHLMPADTFRRLAHCSGSGVLAGALQAAGYGPAPTAGAPTLSSAETIDAAIEHEAMRRLAVLARWLGKRRAFFVGVFEYEDRRVIRYWLRSLFAGERARPRSHWTPGAAALPRRLREEVAAANSATAVVAALRRAASPYGDPLAEALRERGEDLRALERALDEAFAARALRAADRPGGRLRGWVRNEIDLENSWDALAGGGGAFIDGGKQLTELQHRTVTTDPSEPGRRRRLERAFAGSELAGVFDDLSLPIAALESRARAVRIANEHRAARIDPLGAAPILEFVMRLRAERAELRRINWGIAQARPTEAITFQIGIRG